MRAKPKGTRRKGAAAVELAVCLLPLMTIVMGILEGGRLVMAQQQMVNATREGARLASLTGSIKGTGTGTGSNDVTYRVQQSLTGAGIDATKATITVTNLDNTSATDLTSASSGNRIQVSVSIPFSKVSWTTPWFFGGATLTSKCIMLKEAP